MFPGHFLLRVSEGCRRQPPEAHGHSPVLPPVAPLRKCTQTPTDDFTRTSGVGLGGGWVPSFKGGREVSPAGVRLRLMSQLLSIWSLFSVV